MALVFAESHQRRAPPEGPDAPASAVELAHRVQAAFGGRCAWCGLLPDELDPPRSAHQRDHFPALIDDRMWTGYFQDVCVPSCAAHNRRHHRGWKSHLHACWSPRKPLKLRDAHELALGHLLDSLADPVPQDDFRDVFEELRARLDSTLADVDAAIRAHVEASGQP